MKRSVFIRLLFHLTVAMMVITLLVGTLVYRYTNSMLKEEVLGSNTELLDQSRKIVEQAFGEVQQMASSLALNTDVQKSVWLPWNLEEEYRFLKNTGDLFSTRINSSNYIDSIYLYSAVNKKLISSSGITDIADFLYADHLSKFLEGRTTSAWEAANAASAVRSDTVISFYFSVPIQSVKKQGALQINLKEDVLYNAVVNTNKRKLGNVAILNPEGQVLSYKDKSMLLTRFNQTDMERIQREKVGYFVEEIHGEPTLVSFMTSSFNGWIYLTLNPYDEVFKRSKDVIHLTIFISLFVLVLGVLMMVVVSRNYYKPVKKMVMALASNRENPLQDMQGKDEFGFIGESINRLFHENEEFKAKFRSQELILQDHVLVNLLSGKTTDEKDMLRQLEYYGLDLNPEHFMVLVLRVHMEAASITESGEQERNLIYFQIRSICEQAMAGFGKGVYVSQFHRHDVIIMNTGNEPDHSHAFEKAKELALRMISVVSEQMDDVVMTVGIGGKYKKLTEIALSYNEAAEALLYEQVAGQGSILSLHDLELNRSNRNRFIAYRQQVEKLIAELKTGNLDKALAQKDEMITQLNNDSQFGFSYKHMILTHLLNGLVAVRVELVQRGGGPDEEERHWYADFAKLQSPEDVQHWFGELIRNTASELQDKRENKNAEVIEKLTAYIRAHFREPLSLQMLADLVFMNSNYLSKVFKEVTGKTFIDYLTEIRFEEACRLLDNTDKNINEIAELTGFGQKQNVIRTFKKMTGLTPTEYRNRSSLDRLRIEN
ncbi:AraC family transcriptional regulator [Paenibacillus sp. H1-7]|uniref:helix-turn-helix domain-containing protein n=1 Tax=Paenibacillus sp. H1-7 TaxID=2282849 RepID=UPI001EF7D253|nr:helix-turn-helix domain-containing protein [Paenibacillus sp. H1-7]ULL16258.1 AraC family transcriptional regulator [Paenibacillus sp. H1-7]